MSGLNIRNFAKVEPSDEANGAHNQQVGTSCFQETAENDSDDSDAGIQYLAPDDTPVGKR